MRDTDRYESNFAISGEPSDLDGLTEEQRQRLTDILDGYLRAIEGGLPPSREQIIEQQAGRHGATHRG